MLAYVFKSLKYIFSVVGFCVALLAAFSDASRFVFLNYTFSGWQIAIAAILALLLIVFVFQALEDQQNQIGKIAELQKGNSNLRLELDNLRVFVVDESLWKNVDPVTGLPNYDAFQRHVTGCIESTKKGAYGSQPVSGHSYFQAIFMNLDGLKSINDSLGFDTTNKVLQFYARTVHQNMRRNEYMFSLSNMSKGLPRRPESGLPIQTEPLGGEFCIIIEDDWFGALGFLKRQYDNMQMISENIGKQVGGRLSLDFHAGVSPIYADDTEDSVVSRFWQAYKVALHNKYPLRVCWHDLLTLNDYYSDDGQVLGSYDLTPDVIRHSMVSRLEKEIEFIRTTSDVPRSASDLDWAERSWASKISKVDDLIGGLYKG